MTSRVVFDCMVFLQTAARPDRLHGCFRAIERQTVRLCLSPDVVIEIREVLTRPQLRRKFPALTREAVNAFIVYWLKRSEFFLDVPHVWSLPRDPKDEKYVNLAIAAGATHLVTRDHDLLDLVGAASVEAELLRRHAPVLQIVTPEYFIAETAHGADPSPLG